MNEGPTLKAEEIRRGAGRFLWHQGWSWLPEVSLPNGRRTDMMGLDAKGKILIVEIKSSLNDFRTDSKWQDYLPFCDYFSFCVAPGFPLDVIPDDVGLILADTFGAEQLRAPMSLDLAAARRKALILRLARLGMQRHMQAIDPEGMRSWGGEVS